jgi:hypothetical protein
VPREEGTGGFEDHDIVTITDEEANEIYLKIS